MSKQLHEYKTTAEEAKAIGDKHFLPNKPCARGHVELRYVSGKHGCVTCNHLRHKGEAVPPLKGVYGVGFNSAIRTGIPVRKDGKISKAYDAWRRMLQRCYDPQYKIDHPTYIGVECCEDWKDYQNFAKWFYTTSNFHSGFELDKDLLVQGNKIYSPETCCFLPSEINKTLSTKGSVSTYKSQENRFTFVVFGKFIGNDKHYLSFAEEVVNKRNERVKKLADKWKDLLTPQAYLELINYRFMYSLDGSMYRGFY